MEWRPIETAPRDGRRILAWNDDVHLIVSGVPGRWYENGEPYEGKYARARPLTHWMPLPAAPEVLEEE